MTEEKSQYELDWGARKTYSFTVTASTAAAWLGRNTHNRPLRQGVVELYAREIASGHWLDNGETIKFSDDGVLLDGQHRLAAIIKTGMAVKMIVVTGLPEEAQDTIDVGRKRTAGDALTLRGEGDGNSLAAVVRNAVLWDCGINRYLTKGLRTMVSTNDIVEYLEKHPDIRQSVEVAHAVRRQGIPLSISMLGLAHWLFSGIDPDLCEWFFTRLGDGASLPSEHPILMLRKRIFELSSAPKKYPESYLFAFTIKTWNALRRGKEMRLLAYRPNSKEPFPEPQ